MPAVGPFREGSANEAEGAMGRRESSFRLLRADKRADPFPVELLSWEPGARWEPGAALERPADEDLPHGVPGAVLLTGDDLGGCTAAAEELRSLEGANGGAEWKGAPAEAC